MNDGLSVDGLRMEGVGMEGLGVDPPRRERLILAVADVTSFLRACAQQGDERSFAQLRDYYALVAREVEPDGQIIKVIGDAVLLTFPTTDAEAARACLRNVRTKGTEMWRAFDSRCSVEVKLAVGEVLMGRLGAPGDERLDVMGGALNTLLRSSPNDYGLGAPLRELPKSRA